jgi:hypothetical protein
MPQAMLYDTSSIPVMLFPSVKNYNCGDLSMKNSTLAALAGTGLDGRNTLHVMAASNAK